MSSGHVSLGGDLGGREVTSGGLSEDGAFVIFFLLVTEEFSVFFLLCSAVAVVCYLCAGAAPRHVDLFRLVEQLFEFSICH